MKGMDKRIGYGSKLYEESLAVNTEAVRLHTIAVNEQLWMNNLGQNIPIIRAGKDLKNYPRNTGKPCLIIGGGPSVTAKNEDNDDQLDILYESSAYHNDKVFIIACDKMLKACLEKGIYPHMVTGLDGTTDVTEFFRGIDLDLEGEVAVALSVMTHPDTLVEAMRLFGPENVYWFMGLWDDHREPKSMTRIIHWLTNGKVILQTLGNVGALSLFVGLHLDSNEVAFMGLDYGYPADTPIEETQYYNGYRNLVKEWNTKLDERNAQLTAAHEQEVAAWEKWRGDMEQMYGRPMDFTSSFYDKPKPPAKLKKKNIYSCYRYIINPDTHKHVLVGLNWDVYRQIFLSFARLKPGSIPLINVSPTSSLYGPGIKTQSLEEWLKEVDAR